VATSGRPAPVHIRVPINIFRDEAAIEDLYAEPEYQRYPAHRPVADHGKVRAALGALLAAQRPVIVCGQGALISGAGDVVLELAERLRASDSASGEGKVLAKQALESARETQNKLSVLENKIAESQSQQVALEALYQDLSRSRDEWVLAEIEQMLNDAAQQLELAGNVQGALYALRAAEARLARLDRPQFTPLRRCSTATSNASRRHRTSISPAWRCASIMSSVKSIPCL